MRQTTATARAAVLLALVGLGLGTVAGSANAEPGPPPGPAPEPAPTPKTTIDADGTYVVGQDIVPGTYASAGPIENGSCYWKRMKGDKLVDNAMSKKPQVVRIEATDTQFVTNDCQPWQLNNNAVPPPQASPQEVLGQLATFIGGGILKGPPR